MTMPASGPSAIRRLVLLIGAGVLLALGLTLVHLARQPAQPGEPRCTSVACLTEDAFRTVAMFLGGAAWVFDPPRHAPPPGALLGPPRYQPGVALRLYALLATLLLGSAVVLALLRRVRDRVLWWVAAVGRRQHLVIVGFTPEALLLARTACRRWQRPPLVVGPRPAAPEALATFAAEGLPTRCWSDDPAPVLRSARAAGAAHVVALLEEDDAQVDLLLALQGLQPPPQAQVLVQLRRPELAQRLGAYRRFRALTEGLRAHFFTLEAVAAERLLAAHPPDLAADVLGRRQIHVAIWGFGGLGQQLALAVIRLCHTRGGATTRLTILDRDPQAALRRLVAASAPLDDLRALANIEIAAQAVDLAPDGLTDADHGAIPREVTTHIVALPDPTLALATAVGLRRLLLQPPDDVTTAEALTRPLAPILVRTPRPGGLARLLGASAPEHAATTTIASPLPDGLAGFGVLSDLLRPEILADPETMTLASALHDAYRGLDSIGGRPADRPWHAIEPEFLASNLQAVAHLPFKARAVRARILRGRDGTATAPPVDLAPCAEMEKYRYNAERLASGWRFAPRRLDEVRRHPSLLRWEDPRLSEAERGIDAGLSRLPAILGAGGLVLRPTLAIAVTGQATLSPAEEPRLAAATTAWLRDLAARHADRALLLMSPLGPGAETLAVRAVQRGRDLADRIDVFVLLPLPIDLPEREPAGHREEMLRLLRGLRRLAGRGLGPVQAELPLRVARLTDLAPDNDRQNHMAEAPNAAAAAGREAQRLAAGAWMLERADLVLEIGVTAPGTIPATLRAWHDADAIPEAFTTPAGLLPRPSRREWVRLP